LQRRKSAYELGVAISNRTKIEPFSISCSKHSYLVAKRFKEDDILKNGILESVGDGKYLVRVGDGYVQSASGPFILDLRSNSGHRRNGCGIGRRCGIGAVINQILLFPGFFYELPKAQEYGDSDRNDRYSYNDHQVYHRPGP
jgi:hypothetical protein